jgi:hypothetical protein
VDSRKTSTVMPIEGQNYQINKVDCRTAGWLFAFLARKAEGGTILSGLGSCTRDEFNEIQTLILKSVFKMDGEFPIAVLAPDGSIVGTLQEQPELVFRITSSAVGFNLAPFMSANDSSSQKAPDQAGK